MWHFVIIAQTKMKVRFRAQFQCSHTCIRWSYTKDLESYREETKSPGMGMGIVSNSRGSSQGRRQQLGRKMVQFREKVE